MPPTWRYHRTEGPRLIRLQADLDALDGDWLDTPAAWHNPAMHCCAIAGAERGMRHAEDCGFGLPPAAAEAPAKSAKAAKAK